MCTAEIGAIVGIFSDDTKLVRFNLGFRLVEPATLVLLDNTIWINEKFDIFWQRIPRVGSLGEPPQPIKVARFTIPCHKYDGL